MPEHSDQPIAPSAAVHPQPTQRRPDSRLDAANPYAAYQPVPPGSQQPPGNPYAQGLSAHVQAPTNPYASQQVPPAGAPQQYHGQPYASPPAPHAQPQQRTKTARGPLWAVLIAVLVIGGGVTAAALVEKPSFLGFKRVLDHAAVEKTIEQQSGGLLSRVSCPANEKVRPGARFQCSAANGAKVDVVINDSKGNYGWTPAK